MTEDPFERAVSRTHRRRRRRSAGAARLSFRIHAAVYLAVNALLVAIWLVSPSGDGVLPWVVYPALFWGVGLAAHYWAVRGAWRTQGSGVRSEGSGSG